jgi:hypothetical protein
MLQSTLDRRMFSICDSSCPERPFINRWEAEMKSISWIAPTAVTQTNSDRSRRFSSWPRGLVTALALALGMVTLPDVASAQTRGAAALASPSNLDGADVTSQGSGISAAALDAANRKLKNAMAIADQFRAEATARGVGDAWYMTMITNLMKGSEANFANVASAKSLSDARIAAMEVAAAGMPSGKVAVAGVSSSRHVTIQTLGQNTQDLVFVPFTPCRIVDTTVAGGGIPSGVERTFNFRGSVASPAQGGDCDPYSLYTGSPFPAAIAANVNVLALTTAFSGLAYLAAYPTSGQPSTAWLTFIQGDIISNAGVMPITQSTGLFKIFVSYGAHVKIDIFGVFLPPEATALTCVTTTETTISIANGATYDLDANACPGGTTKVSVSCRSSAYSNAYATVGNDAAGSDCQGINTSGGQNTIHAVARCCRIAGR